MNIFKRVPNDVNLKKIKVLYDGFYKNPDVVDPILKYLNKYDKPFYNLIMKFQPQDAKTIFTLMEAIEYAVYEGYIASHLRFKRSQLKYYKLTFAGYTVTVIEPNPEKAIRIQVYVKNSREEEILHGRVFGDKDRKGIYFFL